MAHSFVTSFDHEIDSFRAYAGTFPSKCFLLIDTYDSIEGAKKAVIVGKELEKKGNKLLGVRLDSGDLCELSKEVRRIFDESGLTYVKIVASGDLNEWKIDELMKKRCKRSIYLEWVQNSSQAGLLPRLTASTSSRILWKMGAIVPK